MTLSFLRRRDVLILTAVVVLAAALWLIFSLGMKAGSRAEIVYDGRVILRVDLSNDGFVTSTANPNVRFQIKNGAVAFHTSDCPDKVCVKTGFISRNGQTAACLPNKTSLRIINDDDDVDTVAN